MYGGYQYADTWPDAQDKKYGNTLLHFTRQVEVAEILVRNGADLFVKNKEGLTAEDYHREQGHLDISEYLQKTKEQNLGF